MRLLLVMFLLAGCGHVDVSGTVHHKVELDFSDLPAEFTRLCVASGASDVPVCVAQATDSFLKALGKLK